jgi:hypothetical protein
VWSNEHSVLCKSFQHTFWSLFRSILVANTLRQHSGHRETKQMGRTYRLNTDCSCCSSRLRTSPCKSSWRLYCKSTVLFILNVISGLIFVSGSEVGFDVGLRARCPRGSYLNDSPPASKHRQSLVRNAKEDRRLPTMAIRSNVLTTGGGAPESVCGGCLRGVGVPSRCVRVALAEGVPSCVRVALRTCRPC